MAPTMLDCGLRPEEIHRLKWEENISAGAIEIHQGKRDGSRRRIELTDRVNALLAAIRPVSANGWVFPAPTRSGHIETSSYKKQRFAALKACGVTAFVPYSLRHTCLTRWAPARMDPFTLKYLAGHKSLNTTMRDIHLAGTDAQLKLQETRLRMKSKLEDQGRYSFGHRPQDELLSALPQTAVGA
jgi:integrase